MKRIAALLCALLLLIPAAPAETAWTAEDWAQIRALLTAREALPDKYRLRLRLSDVYLADPAELNSEWQSVLLLSIDDDRTDMMAACRVNRKTGETRVLFLPASAQATLPGQGEQVQLRQMYCFGGPLVTMSAVNQALSLSLTRYCAMNPRSLARIVDGMGGVTLTLTQEEADALGMAPGEQALTSEELVRYAQLRRRWDGGESLRGLVEALVRQASDGSLLSGALALADAALSNMDTNMNIDEIVDMVFLLFGSGSLTDYTMGQLAANNENAIDGTVREACRACLYGEE